MSTNAVKSSSSSSSDGGGVRFSALLARHLGLSRRQAERMVLAERVTLFGRAIDSPSYELHPSPLPPSSSPRLRDAYEDDDGDDFHTNRAAGPLAVKVDGKLIMGMDDTLRTMHAEARRRAPSSGTAKISSDVAVRSGGHVEGGGRKHDDGRSNDAASPDNVRIWLANKLGGELVTEDDPVGRPSMLQRLVRGGVGKGGGGGGGGGARSNPVHLKPVGRLDMMTEGLMVFTNDGGYARELELPTNACWRTYRARVHGRLTAGKMRAMRNGVTVRVDDNNNGNDDGGKKGRDGTRRSADGTVVDVVRTGRIMRYKGIRVSIERRNLSSSRGTRGGPSSSTSSGNGGGGRGTNTWLRITCTEGKNRQLRRILESLGLDVTRLIRISYGDYDLNTIPPGMAIEVKCKGLDEMKRRGPLFVGGGRGKKREKQGRAEDDDDTSAIEWINYS
jgi:pseudouridine synthase